MLASASSVAPREGAAKTAQLVSRRRRSNYLGSYQKLKPTNKYFHELPIINMVELTKNIISYSMRCLYDSKEVRTCRYNVPWY